MTEYKGKNIRELESGLYTAFIDGSINSNLAYRPEFVSNDYKQGKKVLTSIEQELTNCDEFCISVAFITSSGITPLLQTLKNLEQKNIPGKILTTDYLMFTDPKALEKLSSLKNIQLKMYCTNSDVGGFHTKGYIFKKEELYRIIIGSSNMTSNAITTNREWNTKVIGTKEGAVVQDVLNEFNELWDDVNSVKYNEFIDDYRKEYLRNQLIKKQQKSAREESVVELERYTLKPNKMQVAFIDSLKKMRENNVEKALLISATGTGKTYASAFAMREIGFKKVLFLVHRGQLARQTKKSYERVFGKSVSMGLVGSGYYQYDKDYIFATVQTLNRDAHLQQYRQDEFECIILDEAHHSAANTYQKIINYFTPKLWLGMTATPDKRDDYMEGKNIYEIFHYQIAYEIRLQQAMEESLLCPFHYFGITDVSLLQDRDIKAKKLEAKDFNQLVGEQRVKHIVEQVEYYGYSGDRVKGLIFCSRIDESKELSAKFNTLGYRTIALNGDASEDERAEAFERLAMDEEDATKERQPLDYIFSVEILNEGVDIVEVNQVVMLRPTESPIVFIQQLGRGLRKAEGKEYVVIIDFIGNYTNNFMIPIALSGDRSYNADTIRKYVISGNYTIPGASTVHFDEIAKEKIFTSIDKVKGMKSIIKESYTSLKNRLGRVPYLIDFYENGEIDPMVIIREYKSYQAFLENIERELYTGKITEKERLILEYLSKTILSGTRPYELEILKQLIIKDRFRIQELQNVFKEKYGYIITSYDLENAISVLEGKFVSKKEEYLKYSHIDIVRTNESGMLLRMQSFAERLQHMEFYKQIDDLVKVGLSRYLDKYNTKDMFVLYEKYSRRDVSLLMNCGKDLSSTMYGMKRINDDVFLFVTYHKSESGDEEKRYIEGKPNYADAFENNLIFCWDSQMGRGIDSSYVQDVTEAKRKHLLVKKSDAEINFYYMGQFDVINIQAAKKKDNAGKERDIAKFQMRMHHAVREDLLRYLESGLK